MRPIRQHMLFFVAGLLVCTACQQPINTDRQAALTGDTAHPALFGFGTPASDSLIRLWDIDVSPSGAGLPDGSGNALHGKDLFLQKCAACHGPTGREIPGFVLVSPPESNSNTSPSFSGGRTIGNHWPYATTLYDYIYRAMPQTEPGSLTPDEVYSLVAYLLAENGILDQDATLNASVLPDVLMPARDRFVPDDRTGGSVIR